MKITQLNKAYKAKHMITTFIPAPNVASIFDINTGLDAQRQAHEERRYANKGGIFSI